MLPLDEAGFVTIHLVNAGLTGDMAETATVVRARQDVLAIVQDELAIAVRQDSPHYVRTGARGGSRTTWVTRSRSSSPRRSSST